MKCNPLFLALWVSIFGSSVCLAEDLAKAKTEEQILRRKLEVLERRLNAALEESAEVSRPVQSFLLTHLTIGGFFETGLKGVHEPDLGTQVASDENVIGINLSADFGSRLSFVGQIVTGLALTLENQHSDPRAPSLGLPSRREFRDFTYGSLVTQAYLQYSMSDRFNIQGGMGYVPFGITFQEFELVLFTRRGGPLMLRSAGLVSPLWQGINLFGRLPVFATNVHYNLYTFSPVLNPKTLGVGGRLFWRDRKENIQIGLSNQIGRRFGDSYYTFGTDFKLRVSPFRLTAELAKSFGPAEQPFSFYLEPGYEALGEAVLLFAFVDYANDPANRTGSPISGISDPIKKWEYGVGVNWLPTSYTRLRLGLAYNDYIGSTERLPGRSRDYWSSDLSGGVAF